MSTLTELLNFLNTNSGAIQALATVILVLVTFYYAWQVRHTVKIMRNSEEQRNRPRIVIFIEQRENWLNLVDLVISNYGNDLAREVKFSISEDISLIDKDKKLSQLGIIKNGIKDLPPQRTLKMPLVILTDRLEELRKIDLKITVSYTDSIKSKNFSETFSVDFNSLIEQQIGELPIYKLSRSIENIEKTLQKIERKLEKTR